MALKLDREAGWGTRWLALAGLVGLVAVALVIIIDVLLRWLFSSPVDGVSEIARLVAAVAIASFFPMALVDRHNISIEFLGAALGPRARLWLDTFADVVTSLFFLVLGWQFILYTMEMSDLDSRLVENPLVDGHHGFYADLYSDPTDGPCSTIPGGDSRRYEFAEIGSSHRHGELNPRWIRFSSLLWG